MEKNTVITCRIEDMTEQGEGIGKADGFPLFIRDAVIGDEVEARITKLKKTYGYARLLRVISPSPDRTQPRCPVAGPCGGCQLQFMSYESQLAFKRRKVENHLRRIGGFSDITVEPTLGMDHPWEYRNKEQFPIGRNKDGGIAAGFYAGHSHRIVECEHCFLGDPINERILALVKKHMETFAIRPYDETSGRGLVRHVLVRIARATGQVMVCLVINGRKLPHAEELVRALREPDETSGARASEEADGPVACRIASVSVNINRERTNVILGTELIRLYGPGFIVDRIGDISYQISPLSFYQVNPQQTEVLYRTALEFAGLSGVETVWDLYCGIGTISLFLARRAKKVFGVEIIPAAIENARANARLNGLDNTEFFVGRAEEVLPEYYRRTEEETGNRLTADVVVLDPPRKGCDRALLETLLLMQPARIVYVSCDSATLARDCRILADGGYRLKKVQPVDMFPMSVHIECVALLSRIEI